MRREHSPALFGWLWIGLRSHGKLRPWAMVLALAVVSGLSACAGPGAFINEDLRGTKLPDPQRVILVIYTHGSVGNASRDPCLPLGGPMSGAYAVPEVIRELETDNEGSPLVVYALCDPSMGTELGKQLEKQRPAPCRDKIPASGVGWPRDESQIKVCLRARKITEQVRLLVAENPGLERDRIFLAGTSAGAWASLLAMDLAQRSGAPLANAVIGFAPAFSGKISQRSRGWQKIRTKHMTFLTGEDGKQPSYSLPALLFGFEGDPYETPAALASLSSRDGIALLIVPPADRDADSCEPPWWRFWMSAHSCHRNSWFAEEYVATVRQFIACRRTDPTQQRH